MYAVPEKIDQTAFALEAAVKLLDFYDDYFDIPYPLPKQGQCLCYFSIHNNLCVKMLMLCLVLWLLAQFFLVGVLFLLLLLF